MKSKLRALLNFPKLFVESQKDRKQIRSIHLENEKDEWKRDEERSCWQIICYSFFVITLTKFFSQEILNPFCKKSQTLEERVERRLFILLFVRDYNISTYVLNYLLRTICVILKTEKYHTLDKAKLSLTKYFLSITVRDLRCRTRRCSVRFDGESMVA